jgi:hypothetical protein
MNAAERHEWLARVAARSAGFAGWSFLSRSILIAVWGADGFCANKSRLHVVGKQWRLCDDQRSRAMQQQRFRPVCEL